MRLRILISAVALAALIVPATYRAQEPVAVEGDLRGAVKASIDRGIGFIRWNQNEEGDWNADVSLTALALRAFSDSHRAYLEKDGPFIRRPIAYLRSVVEGLPEFIPGETGQDAVMDAAFVRLGLRPYAGSDDVPMLGAAGREYLMFGLVSQDQFDQPSTVFDIAYLLMSLAEDSTPEDNQASAVAVRLLGSYQDVNDTWGFRPDADATEVTRDATVMGVLALLLGGVDPSDVRVTRALDWVEQDYDLESSFETDRFYHYAYGLSQTYHRLGQPIITDAGGNARPWQIELSNLLNAAQEWDGHWINQSSQGDESDPILTTALAVHSLELIYNDPVQ